MSTPQRKYLGLQMNRYSFFFSNVLFFFGELAVLKCFGPQLWGNLMDVQKPHCAENSIKICSLCFDTKFGLRSSAQCASVALKKRACCSDTRGGSFGHGGEKRRPNTCLSSTLRITEEHFCSQETFELIYDSVAQFVAWCWKRCSSALTESSSLALLPLRFGLWIKLTNQIHNWDTQRQMWCTWRKTAERTLIH